MSCPYGTQYSTAGLFPFSRLMRQYRELGIPNLRLKVGPDIDYNAELYSIARKTMGASFDLRVDANGSWSLEQAPQQLALCREHRIHIVEEPLEAGHKLMKELATDERYRDFTFMADESFASSDDLEKIAKERSYGMLNIRLSKNGGLLRGMQFSRKARELGLLYKLGCLVGETGILSALGRVAASVMESPRYVEGSYDKYLLTENITLDDISFSAGGKAEVIRKRGIGYEVSDKKIERLSNESITC